MTTLLSVGEMKHTSEKPDLVVWGEEANSLQVWHKIERYELLGSQQSIGQSQFETIFQSNPS